MYLVYRGEPTNRKQNVLWSLVPVQLCLQIVFTRGCLVPHRVWGLTNNRRLLIARHVWISCPSWLRYQWASWIKGELFWTSLTVACLSGTGGNVRRFKRTYEVIYWSSTCALGSLWKIEKQPPRQMQLCPFGHAKPKSNTPIPINSTYPIIRCEVRRLRSSATLLGCCRKGRLSVFQWFGKFNGFYGRGFAKYGESFESVIGTIPISFNNMT